MGIIQRLSPDVYNKIAAGEVVERPMSVVKELVENSIDAGASEISVKIENGGIRKITVSDNGFGMSREDATECFFRHATSKIRTALDLNAIYTMGFRGEALSSIAAVCDIDLFTKQEQDDVGTKISVRDGVVGDAEETFCKNGTTFVISNMFSNTPARMKFLKRDATEGSYVTDLMIRFILSHPEIAFEYEMNKKRIFKTSGDKNIKNSVYEVYGKDYAKSVVPISYSQDGIKITGLAGLSDTARPNRGYQSFFINKRYVKSSLISKAVEEAYKNKVMIGKFPLVVLSIDLDASQIDINVHPAKMEVKFSGETEGRIFTSVLHAIENALMEKNTPVLGDVFKKPADTSFFKDAYKKEDQIKIRWEETFKKEEPKKVETEKKEEVPQFLKRYSVNSPRIDEKDSAFSESKTPFGDTLLKEYLRTENEKTKEEKEKVIIPDEEFLVIGQAFSTYIIVEKGDELLFIDQHAAHERIKFEELKEEFSKKEIVSQDLLIAQNVSLTPTEHTEFLANYEFFSRLGFEAEDFGQNTLLVRSAPSYIDYEDIDSLLVELINQFISGKTDPFDKKTEYAVYTIACKAAIKANKNLSKEEAEDLVKKVFALGPINTCPHGRPITISKTKREIEKDFKRII